MSSPTARLSALAKGPRALFPLSLAVATASILSCGLSVKANTADDVTATAASSPLDSGASYSGGLPGTASDVTFTAGTSYSGTFTDNTTALSVGTIDDLSSTKNAAISNSQLITLNGGSNSVAPSASDLLYVNTGSTLSFTGTGGIALATSGNFDAAGTMTIGSALTGTATSGTVTLTLSGGGTSTLGTGVINDGGGGGKIALADNSTGTWTLGGASNATTATTYASGATSITLSTALPSGLVVGDTILGSGIPAGTTITAISGMTLTLSNATTAASNTGGVQYTGFSGGFTLNSGALIVGNAGSLGTGVLTLNGGTLEVGGGSSNSVTLGTNNSQFWTGNFGFAQSGASTNHNLNLGTGAVSLAGSTGSLTVSVGAGSTAGLVAATNGLVVGGVVSSGANTNTLIKSGPGALFLNNNANAYSNLQVLGGAVFDTTSVTGGGSYVTAISQGTPFGSGDITLNGGTIGFNTAESSGNTSGYTTLTNNIDLAGNGVVNPGGGQKRDAIFTGLIYGNGQLTLTSTGGNGAPAAAFLSNTNTYTGGTNLDNTGTGAGQAVMYVANALNALGGGAAGIGGVVTFVNNSAVTGQNPTYLVLTANQTVAGLATSTSNTVGATFVTGYGSASAPTLTINSTSGGTGDNSTYAGAIGGTNPLALTYSSSATTISTAAGAGNLINVVKTGTGTQIFSGASTYTGSTTINGGTLSLTGLGSNSGTAITGGTLAGATPITVNTGGMLLLAASYSINPAATTTLGGGTVSLASGVLQGQGATVSGGVASGASLTGAGGLTLAANSTLSFGSTGTIVYSSFTPAGFTLNLTGSNFGTSTSSADGANDRVIFAANEAGNLADITFNGVADASEMSLGNGYYEILPTAVPEAGARAWALVSMVAGLALMIRRRRLSA